MINRDRERVFISCHEVAPMKETSSFLLNLIFENPDGFVTYLRLSQVMPYITFDGIHSSVGRLQQRLIHSGSGFTISFGQMGLQSLGFGLTSENQNHEWNQENLIERARRQAEKDILSFLPQSSPKPGWLELGSFRVLFPEFEIGDYPKPLVALIESETAGQGVRTVFFLSSQEMATFRTFALCGYIDRFVFRQKVRPINKLCHHVPNINRELTRVAGQGFINHLQRLGYPGYSSNGIENRNKYLREIVSSNLNILKIGREARSYLQRFIKWDDNKRTANITICRMDEAFHALGYRELPMHIGGNYKYLLIIKRDDIFGGYDFGQTVVVETTKLAYELISCMKDSLSVRLDGLSPDAKGNLKKKFMKGVVKAIEDSGYGVEEDTGITTPKGIVFPVPFVKFGG
ncbi:hypothetical protein HYT59_00200 [Candidatus Woesebacteria bacterium]|nr:hypothetical protein [Candidatus Woesebacteria bacterium]